MLRTPLSSVNLPASRIQVGQLGMNKRSEGSGARLRKRCSALFRQTIRLANNNSRVVAGVFFLAFLLVGLHSYRDYGLSWDEGVNRENGWVSFNYIFKGDKSLLTYSERYYGVVFEVPLVILEKAFPWRSLREIYFMRHLLTFLVFYAGVYFFYRLGRLYFDSWKIGLLGSLFLVLSPRIFADAFYNSKDLVFLSFFIISMYTLFKFLRKMSLPWAVAHSLSCAILTDVRVLGIMVPCLTLVLYITAAFSRGRLEKTQLRKNISAFLVFLFLAVFFVILFWPFLWSNPLEHFIQALQKMSRFHWHWQDLYMGKLVPATQLPWHYIPVWILITTPVLYTFNFLIGLLSAVPSAGRRWRHLLSAEQGRFQLAVLLWFFGPLLMVIILRSVLYDAWRQMFFIYPAFLLISIQGVVAIFAFLKPQRPACLVGRAVFALAILFSVLHTLDFMTTYHPYQNVYFNMLAGRDLRANWELDYWGLSYRKALEYILERDGDKKIKILVGNSPGRLNADILTPRQKKRFVYVSDPKEAKYLLSEFRSLKLHSQDYPYTNEFYSIRVGRAKIMVVYKLR
jgi:hypothetical protein